MIWLTLGMLVGCLLGQWSIYRHLRKKRRTNRYGWIYTATRCKDYLNCKDCSDSWICDSYVENV